MNKKTENISYKIEITENKSKNNLQWCIMEVRSTASFSYQSTTVAQGEEFSLDDCFKEIKHARLSLN